MGREIPSCDLILGSADTTHTHTRVQGCWKSPGDTIILPLIPFVYFVGGGAIL
jgi:hypothetical protein